LREWAKELEHLHASGEMFCPRMMAHVYLQLGDKKLALYWLEQGYQHREQAGALGGLTWLDFDHEFDALRSDPKFKDLVRRVGLPQT
jgi:dTDP-4-dehydrorhamnose 3,5-epimerase-like enzyme